MSDSSRITFVLPTTDRVSSWVSVRAGETRLGETIKYRNDSNDWQSCKFHILGVKESVGPQLNIGRPGAEYAFDAFISRFLNTQANEFIEDASICLHGFIAVNEFETTNEQLVIELDDWIADWTQQVIKVGGMPILVGGGHNNAYPLIKGSSLAKGQKINVVNLDPHADVRDTSNRHSGNSFSTAFQNNFLDKYSVLGLHEAYNNQFILDSLRKMKAYTSFFESWIDEPLLFEENVNQVFNDFSNSSTSFGLELDMDAIEYMPSSAFTPTGITITQARKYIRKMAKSKNVCYLNLTEAAPTNEQEQMIVGKTLSYLVLDFIKVNSAKK